MKMDALLLWVMMVSCVYANEVYRTPNAEEIETSYWMDLGVREVLEAEGRPKNTNKAKNIILFIGDGMGITANTAGRILKGQKKGHSGEEGYLVWDRFHNIGLTKTYNLDKQVPDSAATGTAFLAGVKANYYTLGVNGKVLKDDCEASLNPENHVDTVLKWAQDAGKATGFITTTHVTHATPGALYAKTANRYWQCDTNINKAEIDASKCKDIARQLVEDEPGKYVKVVMGGGRQEMGAPKNDSDTENRCVRTDEVNLVEEWLKYKEAEGKTAVYATNTKELKDINPETTDYIMGLFDDHHLPYEIDRDTSLDGAPSVEEMVTVAIRRLQQDKNGFFLMVEGGRIDHGLHYTQPKRALEELLAMEKAVKKALEMTKIEETLVIVTADHSHVMTMNGYPERGNDIFGITTYDDTTDNLPYTTLMFTTGHGYNYTWNGEKVIRRNLTGIDTTDKDFEPLAAVPTKAGSETHGGEDVAVFAQGPMAHLFHRVHEQTFVAHVMGRAACIGPYTKRCPNDIHSPKNLYRPVKQSGCNTIYSNLFLIVMFSMILVFEWIRS